MMKKFLFTYIFINCFFLQAQTINHDHKETWITVFIHGSFSLKPHLNLSNIMKMLNDSIEESVYYRSTEINRRDPFFYKNP